MVTPVQERQTNFGKCSEKSNIMCCVLNIYHIRRGLKHWGYRHHWNTNMIQVYTILHAIDEADSKKSYKWHLIHQQGAPSEMIQKEMPPESEEQLLFTVCD